MRRQSMNSFYSFRSRVLHAVVALIVILLVILGLSFDALPPALSDQAYMLHKSFGILVLCLMLIRIVVIYKDGRPKPQPGTRRWEYITSRTVQYSLYGVLILMPISGWIMSVAAGYIPRFFNLFNLDLPFIPLDKKIAHLFSNYHYYFAWVLGSLLILHILGSVKHYFWDKDKLVQSMWKFKA